MLNKIFNKEYLFSTNPPLISYSDKILFAVFFALLVLSLVALILKYLPNNVVYSRFFRRLSGGMFLTALIGAVWAGLRNLAIPYLGARFCALLIFAGSFVWLVFILKYVLFKLRKDAAAWRQEQIRLKYLRNT